MLNWPTRPARCGLVRSRSPVELARARLRQAKDRWSNVSVAVLRGQPAAADLVPDALDELRSAFAVLADAIQADRP